MTQFNIKLILHNIIVLHYNSLAFIYENKFYFIFLLYFILAIILLTLLGLIFKPKGKSVYLLLLFIEYKSFLLPLYLVTVFMYHLFCNFADFTLPLFIDDLYDNLVNNVVNEQDFNIHIYQNTDSDTDSGKNDLPEKDTNVTGGSSSSDNSNDQDNKDSVDQPNADHQPNGNHQPNGDHQPNSDSSGGQRNTTYPVIPSEPEGGTNSASSESSEYDNCGCEHRGNCTSSCSHSTVKPLFEAGGLGCCYCQGPEPNASCNSMGSECCCVFHVSCLPRN